MNQTPEMTVEDAFRVLDQATAGIQTTRQGHHMMGLALSTLAQRINTLEARAQEKTAPTAEV